MKRIPLLALTILATTLSSTAQAQEDVEIAEFVNLVDSTINSAVNAATLFTSQESVSSGYFKFKSTEDPDTKLDVFRIPGQYSLCDDKDAMIRPFVRGQLGSLKVRESITPIEGATGVNDFSVLDVWTVEGGGGADIEPLDGLVITPEASIAYSRIENRYDYNNDVSQFLQPILDGQVFNTSLDVLTYSPKIKVAYTLPLEDVKVRFSSRYSYLYNDSFSTESDIVDVSSDTSIFQNGVEVKVPTGLTVLESPVAVRPFFVRSDIHGSAKDGLGFGHFYEGGLDIHFGMREAVDLPGELTVGTSYTFGDNFEGWRVGLGYIF